MERRFGLPPMRSRNPETVRSGIITTSDRKRCSLLRAPAEVESPHQPHPASVTLPKSSPLTLLSRSLRRVTWNLRDTPVLDIGSGAGFPGLAMKLCRPEDHFHLLEPRKKRAAFCRRYDVSSAFQRSLCSTRQWRSAARRISGAHLTTELARRRRSASIDQTRSPFGQTGASAQCSSHDW